MTTAPITRRSYRTSGAMALTFALMLTACNSKDSEHASQMTSFSATASKSATRQLH